MVLQERKRSLVESYFLKLNSHLKAIFQALLTELIASFLVRLQQVNLFAQRCLYQTQYQLVMMA